MDRARFPSEVAKYLRERYPDEVEGAQGADVLAAFVESRKRLLDRWASLKPQLSELSTSALTKIAGCSIREAIRIKKGEVALKLSLIAES